MNSPNLSGAIVNGGHTLPVRVYYEDTDYSGVVYHAGYLRFMERGRTDYLRLLGVEHRALFEQTQQAPGLAFVVRAMQIEFLKPARMDDVLEISTAPREVKGASITLHQRVMRAGEMLVDANVRIAVVAAGKPQRIPEALRKTLQADQNAALRA